MFTSLVQRLYKQQELRMPTFVLNDEKVVNSYGFRVKNSGINFARFDANPVMLDTHQNTTKGVVGNWKNRRVEGSQLLADSNFDMESLEAKELSGKVDRGFVKGASMGLGLSFDPSSWEKAADGTLDLCKSELCEGSVCGVPSNGGSLALFNLTTGEPITEDQLKLTLKNLTINDFKNPNTPAMEKIILTPAAMSALLAAGVTAPDNASEISCGVETLQVNLASEKTRADSLQTKLTEQIKLQAETMVDAAILDEKILKGDREEWVNFSIANLSLATRQIAKLPGKVNLSGRLHNSEGDASVKTADDFEKLTEEKKLAFKNGSPEAYKKLFAN
jgi:hypothetical protein